MEGGGGEEEGGGVVASAGGRDEDPAFILLGLMLVGDEGEAELLREPGDRLVIVADDEAMWAKVIDSSQLSGSA